MSSFTKSLLDRITYHTQVASTEIAFENLKKMHPSFTESNPFALAYMASNPAIPEDEREILKECFRRTVDSEQRTLQRFLKETGNLRFPCDPSLYPETNDISVNGLINIPEGGVVGEPLVPYNVSDNYIATSSVITNDNVRRHENSDINVSVGDN